MIRDIRSMQDGPLLYSRLPIRSLLPYLFETLCDRSSTPVGLCYSDRATRELLVDAKQMIGWEWPAQFRICSVEEAEA